MKCIIIRKSRILTFFNVTIALIVAVSLTITVIAVERINSDVMLPISKTETNGKFLALTVNVYESTDTDAFLEILEENKATFFISEVFQESYPQKVKEIAEKGHTIGLLIDYENNLSRNDLYDLLAVRIERMSRITGKNAELIRFDKENYDENSVRNIYSIGLLPVHYSESKNELSPGEILLVDNHKAVDRIIKKTVAEGFKAATVDELIRLSKND